MRKWNKYWIYKAALGSTSWCVFNAKIPSQLNIDVIQQWI